MSVPLQHQSWSAISKLPLPIDVDLPRRLAGRRRERRRNVYAMATYCSVLAMLTAGVVAVVFFRS